MYDAIFITKSVLVFSAKTLLLMNAKCSVNNEHTNRLIQLFHAVSRYSCIKQNIFI